MKDDTDYPSCARRIIDELANREEYLEEMFKAIDEDSPFDGHDDPFDALYEYPLEIQEKKVYKVLISYGGPSDYLEIIVDSGEIEKISYHFADWFDHAQVSVDSSSPFWRYAELLIMSGE